MVDINHNYASLGGGYLFSEIGRRTKEFQARNPDVKIMKLGIGNTTLPLTINVLQGLHDGVDRLSVKDTYSGYGTEQGEDETREAIVKQYGGLEVELTPGEIFVSDGAKPDTANIQSIFSTDTLVAVQDPAYPVYVDTNVIAGRGGKFDEKTGQYPNLVYMSCNEENGFMPDLAKLEEDSERFGRSAPGLIYLCSPNNPTGAVFTKEQLADFVAVARKHDSLIVFDAAYSAFIQDPTLPKSIYEIEGADECAIEIQSLSKSHGFTGVRLGWTVVPKNLRAGNKPGLINSLWDRRQGTFFNGASNIVQRGAVAALSPQGLRESADLVDYYMENAKNIKEGLESIGLQAFGGENAPYIWLKAPNEMTSWDFFDKLLSEANIVGTPGSGFGPSGEGFFRLSGFGSHEDTEKAISSIKENLKL